MAELLEILRADNDADVYRGWIDRKIYLNHCPFLCYGAHTMTPGNFSDTCIPVEQYRKGCPRLNMLFPTQYDVGVDNNDFTPVSFGAGEGNYREAD